MSENVKPVAESAERNDYKIENAIVTDVKFDGEQNRVSVELNQSFESIDFKTGETVQTSTFSIDKLNLSQQRR